MKLKVVGYYYPPIETAVPGREWATFPTQLSIGELAQLFTDLRFLPQPTLRAGEASNLARYIYQIGIGRVGKRFNREIAKSLVSNVS